MVLSLNGGCIFCDFVLTAFEKNPATESFFSLVSVTMHPGPQTSNLIFTLKWNLCGNWLFSAFVNWNFILSTSSKTPAWFCKCLNCVLIFKSRSVSIQLCVSLLDRGFVLFLTSNSRNLVVAFPVAGEIYVYFWSSTVDKILKRANITNVPTLPVYSFSFTYGILYIALLFVSVPPFYFVSCSLLFKLNIVFSKGTKILQVVVGKLLPTHQLCRPEIYKHKFCF